MPLLAQSTEHSSTRQIDARTLERVLSPVQQGSDRFMDGTRLVLNLGHAGQLQLELARGQEITIGRDPGPGMARPAVVLDDRIARESGMSRLHAAIRRTGDQLFLLDLGSTNGTHLNHRLLPPHEPFLLHDGDILRFGLLDLRMRYVQESTEQAEP
jgi:pSer/pThr/pTyr-binding forkhead associated (FHA) protein